MYIIKYRKGKFTMRKPNGAIVAATDEHPVVFTRDTIKKLQTLIRDKVDFVVLIKEDTLTWENDSVDVNQVYSPIYKGQTVYAIDPCTMEDDDRSTLTVGKGYVIEGFKDDCLYITDDEGTSHDFAFEDFDEFFTRATHKLVLVSDKVNGILVFNYDPSIDQDEFLYPELRKLGYEGDFSGEMALIVKQEQFRIINK